MSHNTMIFFAGWVSGVQATGTARIATSIARVARERDPTNRMLNLFRCGQQKAGRSSGFFDFVRKRRGYLLTVALIPTLP